MKITCLGAARTVTGSCYLTELDDGTCFLVDCGMFQGGSQIELRNRETDAYRVSALQGIFLTHAHIDHSGLVPKLVRQGYDGPIYATEATCDLLRILWLDSAHIQEMESEWQSRKNRRKGSGAVEALYETADAEKAISMLAPVLLNESRTDIPGVTAQFVIAGHILGAGSLHLTLRGREGEHRVGFSGDIGRPGQLIIPDPEFMPPLNTLFMETTYGSRLHKSVDESQEELLQVVNQAYQDGGKVIIPAFAVERTQEIIYVLAKGYREGRLPKDMPVYLDSPLAIKSTVIFRKHPELFDEETQDLLDEGHTPINLPTLRFTPTTDDSRKINESNEPSIIIAGSGMANAGRIKHHLKHNLWRPNCHVVIVGFQAQGTTGRRLVEGASSVRIFREDVSVKASVHTIGGFSAHADQRELLDWLEGHANPGMMVHLIHGEESASLAFRKKAKERFPDMHFDVPRWKDTITLGLVSEEEEREPVKAAADPAALAAWAGSLSERLARIEDDLSHGRLELDAELLGAVESALRRIEETAGSESS